jgi:hypothetical protein
MYEYRNFPKCQLLNIHFQLLQQLCPVHQLFDRNVNLEVLDLEAQDLKLQQTVMEEAMVA